MATKRPPKILTLDTETIGLDGALKKIGIYDGVNKPKQGYTFEDIEDVIYFWYNNGYMPHIYIHNADFDLRKIPEVWELGNVIWSRTKKIGTKYARVQCKNYVIHDSLRLLPFSLEKLSKDFGLEHGKVDLWEAVQEAYPDQYTDKVDFLNRCDPDDPIYCLYLDYDVISLYELIYKLIEVSGIPEEDIIGCLSTASMSKYVLKNGYKGITFGDDIKTDYQYLTECQAWSSKKTMKWCNISYEDCEYKIREGFYGGRTEVFTPVLNEEWKDGERVITGYHYDVNSLYPFTMSLQSKLSGVLVGCDFPIGYPNFEDDSRICSRKWKRWLENHDGLGFIKATVNVPPQAIPPLPAKLGKLAFVTGIIQGTWTYNELEYAVKNCGVEVLEIHEMIHFKKTHQIFKRFVEVFYEMKSRGKIEGNPSLTAFAKLMLNTAYGWTVLRRDDKTALRDISMYEKYKDDDKFIIKNDEFGYIEIWDDVRSDSIQVQVGAYVTSYARLVLLDALRHAADRGTVYYCDTDSIVTSHPFPPEMVDPVALGKWDLESELYSGLFLQPKVYYEDKKGGKETIKFKGVSRKTQAQLKREKYEEIYNHLLNGDDFKMLIEQGRQTLPSLAVAQKKHIDPNQFKVTDKTIDLGAKGKRDFDYKQNRSKPWHMETLDDFKTFNFAKFDNPPEGKNLFGG